MGEFNFEPIIVDSSAPGGACTLRTFDDIGTFILNRVDVPHRLSEHRHAVRQDLPQARFGARRAEVHAATRDALAAEGWLADWMKLADGAGLGPRPGRNGSPRMRGGWGDDDEPAGITGGFFLGIDGLFPKMLHCDSAVALVVSEFPMNDVVDRVLNIYQLMRPLDPDQISDSRRKVTRYIESLASAGQNDAKQLAVYGLAYLKELHDGPDPRFTGC